MSVSSNWVGKGKDPLFRHSPDGNTLARIIKMFHQSRGGARVNLKVAELHRLFQDNFTSEIFNREDNSRDYLGKHWQDKMVSNRTKRRLL